MARPIKETPVLKGKDARAFEKAIKENENKKVSPEEYHRVMNNYHNVKVRV